MHMLLPVGVFNRSGRKFLHSVDPEHLLVPGDLVGLDIPVPDADRKGFRGKAQPGFADEQIFLRLRFLGPVPDDSNHLRGASIIRLVTPDEGPAAPDSPRCAVSTENPAFESPVIAGSQASLEPPFDIIPIFRQHVVQKDCKGPFGELFLIAEDLVMPGERRTFMLLRFISQ